jgi:hypothetical protein
MSKRKFNELNDIIDTAYVEADYSDSNRYYDNTCDYDVRRRDENIGQMQEQPQEPYRFGFSSNNSFRSDRSDRGDRGDRGNIFLKKSQNIFQSSFNNANKTNSEKFEKQEKMENPELNRVVLNDDNFPSLGSNSTKVNKPGSVQNKLDFKKVVEKKPEVVNKTEPNVSTMGYKKSNYSQYSMYHEIREQSERIAKWKMGDDVSSDDNGDDNYY